MDYFTRLSIRKERSTQLLRSVEINIFRLSPFLSVMTILDQRAIDAMRAHARLAGNAWYSTVSRANAILSASNSWLARVTDVYAPRSDELERATSSLQAPRHAPCRAPAYYGF